MNRENVFLPSAVNLDIFGAVLLFRCTDVYLILLGIILLFLSTIICYHALSNRTRKIADFERKENENNIHNKNIWQDFNKQLQEQSRILENINVRADARTKRLDALYDISNQSMKLLDSLQAALNFLEQTEKTCRSINSIQTEFKTGQEALISEMKNENFHLKKIQETIGKYDMYYDDIRKFWKGLEKNILNLHDDNKCLQQKIEKLTITNTDLAAIGESMKQVPVDIGVLLQGIGDDMRKVRNDIKENNSNIVGEFDETCRRSVKDYKSFAEKGIDDMREMIDTLESELQKLGDQYDSFKDMTTTLVQQLTEISEADLKRMKELLQ